jgi:hypothetical protein
MAQINYGKNGGITVHDTSTHAVVEVPRFEPRVAAQFKGKVQGGFYADFVKPEGIVPQDKYVLLGADKNFLRNEKQIRDFNHRVAQAAAIHTKLTSDFENIHELAKFDLGGTKPVFTRYGQDEETVKTENGTEKKKKAWAYGTVVALNDSFVAFESGQNDTFQYARVLPLEKFIQTPEQKAAYDDYLSAKIANPSADVENPFKEQFKIGEYKELTWKKEGKNTVIAQKTKERTLESKSEAVEEKQEQLEKKSTIEKVAQAAVEQEVTSVAKKKSKKKEATMSM